MVRGCSKEPSGGSETPVEGYSNVMAKTSICSTSSCNKVAGSVENIVKAVTTSAGTGDVAPEAENDVAVGPEPESGALAVIMSLSMMVMMML